MLVPVKLEAPPGFEPGMTVLQTVALPLGYGAVPVNAPRLYPRPGGLATRRHATAPTRHSVLDNRSNRTANEPRMQPTIDSEETLTRAGRAPTRVATRAVIFDLDNVLVWSVPMHWKAFERTFAAEGKAFPFEEYRRIAVGAAREEVIRHVLGELPEGELQRLMAEKERHVSEYLRTVGVKPIEGALELVRLVKARRLKAAVASASRSPELILDGIGARHHFDAVIGRGQVARSKPYPDVFLRAAAAIAVRPEECLVIEDSPLGIEAALAAGMRVIALTTTEPPSRLTRATAVVSGFDQIDLDRWV